ncbi:MAG: sigma-70 family RNA polymerase sigma factor, partial [Alphaproteobacteria bacterium]|nr:sigma-70 family RNA polymerase sigma factor [Alphaproteobacteria bacterium]
MNRYDGIDKRIVLNVKMYAKNLKRRSIFRSMDLEDLEQELMCRILSCIGKFDEGCGKLEHFIRKILKRRCATLIETYMRKKRDSIVRLSEYSDEIHGDSFIEFRELIEKQIEAS